MKKDRNKKIAFSTFALFALAFMVSASNVSADQIDRPQLSADQKQELKDLKQSGDKEALMAKLAEFGISQENMGHKKMPNEEIKKALDSGDYQEFLKAIEGKANFEKITQENFNVMVQAEKLRSSGDKEGAKKLMEDSGIKMFDGRGHNLEKNQNLTDEQKQTLEKAHELRDSGDKEGAKTLMQSVFGQKDSQNEKGIFQKIGSWFKK